MQRVFVTGASRGLGLEFVRQYREAGFEVIAACRQPAQAKELTALAKAGGIEILPMDVIDFAALPEAASTLAGKPIDILINNAGIFGKSGEALGHVDVNNMQQVLHTNCIAPLMVTEALLDNVLASELKTIVAITSGLGSISSNTRGKNYSYRASKAGLNAVMQSLAIDLADQGAKVLVICPGWVRTDLGGEHAILSVEDSVNGIRQVIADEVRLPAPGYYQYDGQLLPW